MRGATLKALKQIRCGVPLAVAMLAGLAGLAGCGGGGGAGPAATTDRQAGSIAVGEPHPAALSTAPFIAMARDAACVDTRNRLFVIDGKRVFWDHAGQCADAAYGQVLFADRLDTVLCSHGDTIAGPRTSCADEAARALFETALAHPDQLDLGLGSAHQIEQLAFLPKAGSTIAFSNVASSAFSGIKAPRQVVIRDQAAWQALWAEHGAYAMPAPDLPKVDFARRMLVAVFGGQYSNGCYGVGITSIKAGADKVKVEVTEHGPQPGVACSFVVVSPMQVVALDRIDAEVVFDTKVPAPN